MDIIKEINEKYQALEAEVDGKLEKTKRDEMKFDKSNSVIIEKLQADQSVKVFTYEEAKKRNGALLKTLEMTKARLRSRATFSPIEQILGKALHNYKISLQLSQKDLNIACHSSMNENIYDEVV